MFLLPFATICSSPLFDIKNIKSAVCATPPGVHRRPDGGVVCVHPHPELSLQLQVRRGRGVVVWVVRGFSQCLGPRLRRLHWAQESICVCWCVREAVCLTPQTHLGCWFGPSGPGCCTRSASGARAAGRQCCECPCKGEQREREREDG